MLSQQHIRSVVRTTTLLAVCIAFVAMLDGLGFMAAVDARLRAVHYAATEHRTSAHQVVLVAGDANTVTDWGPPPWTTDRVRAAVATVLASQPNLLLIADENKVVVHEASGEDPLGALRDDVRVDSGPTNVLMRADGAGVEWLSPWLEGGQKPGLHQIAVQKSIVAGPTGEDLAVHYLASKSGLPTYSLHAVAQGLVPAEEFAGKLVIVGVTDPQHTQRWPTPVGRMSAVEIHAHAITGLVDGVVWRRPDFAQRLMLSLLTLAIWVAWLRKRRPGQWWICALSLSVMWLGVDHILYRSGLLALGAAQPIVALWSAHILETQRNVTLLSSRLDALRSRLAELSADLHHGPNSDGEDAASAAFWQDLVDLGRTYLRLDAQGLIAELPASTWHLRMRATTGIPVGDVEEKRRDVRRAPFRGPYLTHRAGWAEGFLRDRPDESTLLVPLHGRGRLYGFWLLHFTGPIKPSDEEIREIEALGRQMAEVIGRRRLADAPVVEDAEHDPAGETVADAFDRAVSRWTSEHKWSLQLLERQDSCVMMASLWGPIEFANQPMIGRMRKEFPDGIPGNDIRAVIAKFCDLGQEEVQTLMRSVIVDGDEIVLPQPSGKVLSLQAPMNMTLRRVELDDEDDDMESSISADGMPNFERARLVLWGRPAASKFSKVAQLVRGGRDDGDGDG